MDIFGVWSTHKKQTVTGLVGVLKRDGALLLPNTPSISLLVRIQGQHSKTVRPKTPYCTSPYSLYTPLVKYALIIDAGLMGYQIQFNGANSYGPLVLLHFPIHSLTKPCEWF